MYSVCTQIFVKYQETGPDKNCLKFAVVPHYYCISLQVIQKIDAFLIPHDHPYIL